MSNTTRNIIIAIVAVVFLTMSFGSGFILGSTRPASDEPAAGSLIDLGLVEEAWQYLQRDYVDKAKLQDINLTHAAINGIVEAVDDPHTAYLDPDTYQLSTSQMEGKFDGIGAEVSIKDKMIVIIAPMPGSPAERAGIKPGDIILEIDGQSTQNMNLTEAVLKIRGPRGTTVKIRILPAGKNTPVEVVLTREEIKPVSARLEMRDGMAYIRLSRFSEPTAQELAAIIGGLGQQGAKGIILDLRTNPGGLLQSVVDIAGYFLREGVVVKVIDSQGQETVMSVRPSSVYTDLPMVILVDPFSASASEVLSGALRDNGRAVLAGAVTYGKGSVNILRRLQDGSGIYITVARWYTPNGTLIEGQGLKPDYELETEGEATIDWAVEFLKKGQK